jgi:hypothetical protein
VLWDAEIAPSVHRDSAWEAIATKGVDDPEVFGAYLRTVAWNTATAADRDLFQAPFRAGIRLDAYQLKEVETFQLDPDHTAFADDPGWGDAFDDVRSRRRARRQRLSEWRRQNKVRAIAFEPLVLANGTDATDVVQVHLEHRLVRRQLSRFQSHGFQSGLHRACVIRGTGAQPRIVLLGRLSLYGPAATRLHEVIGRTGSSPEAIPEANGRRCSTR